MNLTKATAFAPATVANVAVGFDLLGFALENPGDTVTVEKINQGIVVESIPGANETIPLKPEENTASASLLHMIQDLKLQHGFKISIQKGIPLGSGVGGSAASAVAAVVAANQLLPTPLRQEALLEYAVNGESVASLSRHPDNVAPCLMGGLILTVPTDPFEMVRLPVPSHIRCVIALPKMRLDTKQARAILRRDVPLKDHVLQSGLLAGFVAALDRGDLTLLTRVFKDTLIEPQRAPLIPGFEQAKTAALNNGAIGFSISGAGPSVFAWADSEKSAKKILAAISEVFQSQKLPCRGWISKVSQQGAKILGVA